MHFFAHGGKTSHKSVSLSVCAICCLYVGHRGLMYISGVGHRDRLREHHLTTWPVSRPGWMVRGATARRRVAAALRHRYLALSATMTVTATTLPWLILRLRFERVTWMRTFRVALIA